MGWKPTWDAQRSFLPPREQVRRSARCRLMREGPGQLRGSCPSILWTVHVRPIVGVDRGGRTNWVLNMGVIDSVWPVHATKPLRCATIQSTVPSRCIAVKEVRGDLVDMSAVTGVAEVILDPSAKCTPSSTRSDLLIEEGNP
jgi:hypothetical protein